MKAGWRKWHLWLSVPFGLILTIVCWTGASMVFESEITEILNRPLYRVDHPTGDTLLTPSILAEKIRQQTGDSLHLTSLQFFGEKDKVCLARFTETARRSLAVDPYNRHHQGVDSQILFLPGHAQPAPMAVGHSSSTRRQNGWENPGRPLRPEYGDHFDQRPDSGLAPTPEPLETTIPDRLSSRKETFLV